MLRQKKNWQSKHRNLEKYKKYDISFPAISIIIDFKAVCKKRRSAMYSVQKVVKYT